MDTSKDAQETATSNEAQEPADVGAQSPEQGMRPWALWLSWLFSGIWALQGVIALAQSEWIFGLGMLFAAALIAPPIALRLLQLAPKGAPAWVPAASAISIIVISLFANGAVAALDMAGGRAPAPKMASAPAPTAPEFEVISDEERFVEEVDTILLPALDRLSDGGPVSLREVWDTVETFERLARRVHQARTMNLDTAQLAQLERLEGALVAKQTLLFPKLRETYRSHARELLWAKDVDVYGADRTIGFVSFEFSRRQSMLDVMEIIGRDLNRLRFAEVQFLPMRGGDGYRRALETPSDREVVMP